MKIFSFPDRLLSLLAYRDVLDGGGGGSLDEDEDELWLSTGGNGRRKLNTTSLYAIKNEEHNESLRKSHSYSMEDLRFARSS